MTSECTKEEIERKRIAALEKRRSKIFSTTQHNASPVKLNSVTPTNASESFLGPSAAGPSKNYINNASRTVHPYAKPETNSYSPCNVPVTKVVTGTVYLISEHRFEVNPSEFCSPLINIFKTIPSRNYNPNTKLWNFSIEDYQQLMSKVTPLAPHVVLGTLPPFVLKILREQPIDPDTIDLSPVEFKLKNMLIPFQAEGVRYGVSRRGRCMIADDMGLGKTHQALAIASYYRNDWPLLIVTTSSMRETWQSKVHELLPSVPVMNIVALNSGRDAQLVADQQTEVVIVSYKMSTTHSDLLKRKKFGAVIIDESHYLKSHKAQCTKALSSITASAARVVLLSGTPALSRPAELFTQLALIEPKLFNFTEYGKRYCAGKYGPFGWDMSGQSNLTELQILLQRRFLIRRTKDQVTDLEEKTRETVILDSSLLEFSKEDARGLSQLASDWQSTSAQGRQAALLSFFSESARVKIPAICKYIKQLLQKETDKFLVFAHHRPMIEAVCLTLDEASTSYICIVGSTPANQRADLVDRFQCVESCRCAVLSVTAANSGLTLTAANLVLFAELHWNPGVLTQAEARAHRIGQRGGVCVRYLLAQGTVDDHIWPMLQNKLQVLTDVGLTKESFDHTQLKHQDSNMNITQYLSPGCYKNKNDYIPGTNIRKDTQENAPKNDLNCSSNSHQYCVNSLISDNSMEVTEDIDSFFEDREGDDLLANLDL